MEERKWKRFNQCKEMAEWSIWTGSNHQKCLYYVRRSGLVHYFHMSLCFTAFLF